MNLFKEAIPFYLEEIKTGSGKAQDQAMVKLANCYWWINKETSFTVKVIQSDDINHCLRKEKIVNLYQNKSLIN